MHLETRHIKGNTYYYACQKGRVNGQPRNVWQKYLGTAQDILKSFSGLPKGSVTPSSRADICEFGASSALWDISQQLQLGDVINRRLRRRFRAATTGHYMVIAAINRALAPTSKSKMSEWYSDTCLPRLTHIPPHTLSPQRFWDHMDLLTEKRIEMIERDIVQIMVKRFGIDLSALLCDHTNFFCFIDSFTAGDLAQRGHNKQHRDNLRQVGLSLIVTRDFHIPILHHVYPGNTADSTQFHSVTESLLRRYRELTRATRDITIIFDKGNNSRENLDLLAENRMHFVGSLVPTHFTELLKLPRSQYKPCQHPKLPGVETYRTTLKVFGVERTVVMTYNPGLFESQNKTQAAVLAKTCMKLARLQSRLKRAAHRKHGRNPTLSGTKKLVTRILKGQHRSETIKVSLHSDKGQVSLSYRTDTQTLSQLQLTLFGKKILFTDRSDWSDEEIVLAYHGQAYVEEAFKRMKDPHFLSWWPQNHWTDSKIRVHAFYCVLALLMASLLWREAHRQGLTLSLPALLADLKEIRQVAVIPRPRQHRGRRSLGRSIRSVHLQRPGQVIISNLTPQQSRLMQIFRLDRHLP